MRIEWWIATAFVLVAPAVASALLTRRGHIPASQAVAMFVLGYALVFTGLWGMKSHFIRYPGVEVPRPVNRMLLAIAGGLLAQLMIIFDRFLNSTLPKNRVAPLYVRGALGALAGLVGLLLASVPYSGVEKVEDNLAALCGAVGGGMGASVLKLAKNRVFGSNGKSTVSN